MARENRAFYCRLGVLRCARDLVVLGAVLILDGAHWLDTHRLY